MPQEARSVSASSRRIDRLEPIFDHDGLVANAGLIVPAKLMTWFGLEVMIKPVDHDGFVTSGPQDLDVGRGDDR